MIQKRTITRGSGQPLSSKWWWIGAMRNTRLPVSLNDGDLDHHRQRLDHEHAAHDHQHQFLAHDHRDVPSAAPSASAPMSPMNTIAG